MQVDDQGLPIGYQLDPQWELTPRQVKAKLNGDESFLFLDCRTEKEHAAAHIAQTLLIPLQELPARVDELPDDQDKPIIVHCYHGKRSLQAASFLRQQGFTNVKSMAGGIDLWSIDIDPAVPRY